MTIERTTSKGLPRIKTGHSGFTLLELLIVIAIITVLSVVTVISVGSIARDVKLSTGINRITSALGTARAEAIRSNTPVMISFRMVKDLRRPGKDAQVEIAVSRWTGELISPLSFGWEDYGNPDNWPWAERYELVPSIPPQLLPEGIKVACSAADFRYLEGIGLDPEQVWFFMSSAPFDEYGEIDNGDGTTRGNYNSGEPGAMIAILFGPDGDLLTRNTSSVSAGGMRSAKWIDFNADGQLETANYCDEDDNQHNLFYYQNDTVDEPFVNVCQYLVVYDEEQAREEVDFTAWEDFNGIRDFYRKKNAALGPWVAENADRLHFNRYTGLSERSN